jgi:hypothetical protein
VLPVLQHRDSPDQAGIHDAPTSVEAHSYKTSTMSVADINPGQAVYAQDEVRKH